MMPPSPCWERAAGPGSTTAWRGTLSAPMRAETVPAVPLDGGAGVVDARLAGLDRQTGLRRELGGQEVGVGPGVEDEQGGDPADLGLDHGRMDR